MRRHLSMMTLMVPCALGVVILFSSGRGPRQATEVGRAERATSATHAPAHELSPSPGSERAPSTPPPAPPAGEPFGAPAGTRLSFAVAMSQSTTLTHEGSAAAGSSAQLRLAGELVLEVLDRREGELLVRLSLPTAEVQLEASGTANDDPALDQLEQELARMAHLRLRADGTCLGWSFAAGTSAETERILDALISLARFVVPADAGTTWRTEERDTSGSYVVSYERVDMDPADVLVRRRLEFAPGAEAGSGAARTSLADEARARLDLALGWPSEIEGRQSLHMDFEGSALGVEVQVEFSWRRTGHGRAPARAQDEAWSLAWSTVRATQGIDEGVDSADAERLLGRTLESVLYDLETQQELSGLQSRETYDARELLKAYLRAHPEDLERFTVLLGDGSLSEGALGVALSALGSVASPEGQAWLGGRLADPGWSENARLLSMFAAFQVAEPSEALRAPVLELWQDSSASSALRGTALLLLGTQARGSEEHIRQLLAEAPRARSEGYLPCFVSALGNARLTAEVQRFLDHPDSNVRAAARHVLSQA